MLKVILTSISSNKKQNKTKNTLDLDFDFSYCLFPFYLLPKSPKIEPTTSFFSTDAPIYFLTC